MLDQLNVLKIIAPMVFAFAIGLAITPFITNFLYKYKCWKKLARTQALDGGEATIVNSLNKETEVRTPRMGGTIIWVTALTTTLFFYVLSFIAPSQLATKMNFLSLNQTWLPLFTLVSASLVGLIDDVLVVRGRGGNIAGGLSLPTRIAIVLAIGAVGAWWFFFKLEMDAIFVPFIGELYLGILFIPFFMLTMLALFSSGVIDGIDGLSGGVMASIFAAYTAIAFFENAIDLAAFSAVITGGVLVFLWFNIPPARFYMSETGILGLTATLTVIAFLTDAVSVLPIIALPLVATVVGNVIQIGSKKLRGKKVFRAAPLHHHFQALGWTSEKVVMRYWIISVIAAVSGVVIHFVGKLI